MVTKFSIFESYTDQYNILDFEKIKYWKYKTISDGIESIMSVYKNENVPFYKHNDFSVVNY